MLVYNFHAVHFIEKYFLGFKLECVQNLMKKFWGMILKSLKMTQPSVPPSLSTPIDIFYCHHCWGRLDQPSGGQATEMYTTSGKAPQLSVGLMSFINMTD